MSAFLVAWGDVVSGAHGLVDQALEVDPLGGTSVAWSASLKQLKVTPIEEDERLPTCQKNKQTKGAPVPEVHAALQAFVSSKRALVLATLTPEQRTVAEAGLVTLLEHAKAHYAQKASEPVKRGLFKHAKVTASKHQYGTKSGPEVYVMECPVCRGPRQTESLSCVFCGADL